MILNYECFDNEHQQQYVVMFSSEHLEYTVTAVPKQSSADPGCSPAQVKRSSQPRGPYKSNRRSRYVEMVLVVDQKVYQDNREDLKATIRRTKEIANIVNSVSPVVI